MEHEKKELKSLFSDMIKYLPTLIVSGLIGLISIPIYTKTFNSNEYGNFSLINSTILLISIIIGWIPMSIIRFYPEYEKNHNEIVFHHLITRF